MSTPRTDNAVHGLRTLALYTAGCFTRSDVRHMISGFHHLAGGKGAIRDPLLCRHYLDSYFSHSDQLIRSIPFTHNREDVNSVHRRTR